MEKKMKDKDIIPVTLDYEELSLEELEERIEMTCSAQGCGNNSCCW